MKTALQTPRGHGTIRGRPHGSYAGDALNKTPPRREYARSNTPSLQPPAPSLWMLAALMLAIIPVECAAQETSATEPAAVSAAKSKPWPGPVDLLSRSAPLDRKSKLSVDMVRRWQQRPGKQSMGPRGEVRFIFGATQDTVVCAPLRICDIALQAGEIVQNINLADPVMWNCPPAISGTGVNQVTHLMCKPADAGLETSLAIQTSRRTYSINLVSTRKNYMPLIAWSYPEDQADQWAAYQQQQAHGQGISQIPVGGYIQYAISGDSPSWRPVEAFSDGKSTYIHFPPSMAYGKAPVLERVP